MKKRKTKKYKEKLKTFSSLLIILVLLLVFVLVIVLARYVSKAKQDFFLKTTEFYFYSDKLVYGGITYQVENWSGVDDYTITINLNSRENNLLTSDYDIAYNITYSYSNNITCQLSKTSGTISSLTNTDFVNVLITPNTTMNTGDVVWVNVSATATTPYEKTISATFRLEVGHEGLSYEITDSVNSPYCDLRITNTLTYYIVEEAFTETIDGTSHTYSVNDQIDIDTYLSLSSTNQDKCHSALVTLAFAPTQVLLDMTSNMNFESVSTTTINGYTYVDEVTLKIDAIESMNIRFYKIDETQNYTYPFITTASVVRVSAL